MTPSRRARRSLTLAVVAGLTLTGCGAGIDAQTNQRRTFSEGANEVLPGGQILIRNFYVAPPDNAEAVWEEGDDVRAYAVFVNQGDVDDQVVGASTPAAEEVTLWSGGDPDAGVDEHTEEFLEYAPEPGEARGGGTDNVVAPGGIDETASPSATTSPDATTSPGATTPAVPATPAGDGEEQSSFELPLGDKLEVTPGSGYFLLEDITQAIYPGTTIEMTVEFAEAGSHTFPAYVQVLSEPAERETPESHGEGDNEPAADTPTDLEAGH